MGDGGNPFRKSDYYQSEWSGYSQTQSDPNYRPESYTNSDHNKFLPYDNNYPYSHSYSTGYGQSNSNAYVQQGSNGYGQHNSQGFVQSNSHYGPSGTHYVGSHNIPPNHSIPPNRGITNVPYGQGSHGVGGPVDGVNLPYQTQTQLVDTNNSFPNRQTSDSIPVPYQDNMLRYNTYPINSVNSGNPVTQVNPGNPGNSLGGMYYQRNMTGYKNDSDVNYYPNYMYYNGQMSGRSDSRDLTRPDLSRDMTRDIPREIGRPDLQRPELYFSRNHENLVNKNFNASLSFKEAATAMLSMDAKKSHSRQRTPTRGRSTGRGFGKLQKPETTNQATRVDQSGPREPNSYQGYANTKPIYPQNYKNIEPINYSQYKDNRDLNRDINRVPDVNRVVDGRVDNRIVPVNRGEMNIPGVNRVDMGIPVNRVENKDPVYNNYYMINSKINSPEYAKYRNRGLQQLSQYNLMSQYSQQHGIGNYISSLNNLHNHPLNLHNNIPHNNVNLSSVNIPHNNVNLPGVNLSGNVGVTVPVGANFPGVRGFKVGPGVPGPQRFMPIPKSMPMRSEKHHVIEEIQADNEHMNNLKTNSISSASSIMESFQHSLSNKRKRIKNCLVEDCRNVIGEQPKIDVQYSSVEVNGEKKYLLSEILSSLLPYHTFYHEQLDPPRTIKFDYAEIRNQIKQVQTLLDNINNKEHIFSQSIFSCVKESLLVCNEFAFGQRKLESGTPQ